jgi:hypothetical protein
MSTTTRIETYEEIYFLLSSFRTIAQEDVRVSGDDWNESQGMRSRSHYEDARMAMSTNISPSCSNADFASSPSVCAQMST